MNKVEIEIRRLLLHMEMINLQARREIECFGSWNCDWASALRECDVELQELIEKLSKVEEEVE